jgi:hypothetical protein
MKRRALNGHRCRVGECLLSRKEQTSTLTLTELETLQRDDTVVD